VGATGLLKVTSAANQHANRNERKSLTMPQDHPRTENQRARSEKSPRPDIMADAPFGEISARSINAGLRMHKQMLDVFEDIGREWFASTTSKAELALKLPNKLTGAGSVPGAFSAYQEWLGEWMNMFGEDSRRFISDSQKIMDAGARCFADTAPLGTS
jgi:hypothetical protein